MAVFLTVAVQFSEQLHVLEQGPRVVLTLLGGTYFWAAVLFRLLLRFRLIDFGRLLQIQLITDIFVIAVFMHYGGGNGTGLGLILTVPMAAAGLHPQTRIMLFLPSLASLAVLIEQGLAGQGHGDFTGGYMRAAMLSIGFFTVAGISHVLAKGALGAARVANEKTREAADLARLNAKVIQDLPYGILVLSADGQILQYNQQAERLVGCAMQGLNDLRVCHADLQSLWQAWLADAGMESAVLPVGEAGRRLRFRLRELGPDRSEGAVLIIEDMSELEHEATQMKMAALGRLTANLAHEIRNPLSAINHAAQLLAEDVGTDRTSTRLTRIIEDNVGRLNVLVEDVLSLSRRDPRQLEAIEIGAFLVDFVSQFQQAESVPPGQMMLKDDGLARVLFDRVHLHQILWNLCRNACRHGTGGPGSVLIEVQRSAQSVDIQVSNDGEAISDELRKGLFEPFFSTEKGGTGLGLYIALELAEANGGQLRCLDRSRGACFRLTAKTVK